MAAGPVPGVTYGLDTSAVLADRPVLQGEVAISTCTVAQLHPGVLVTINAVVRAERLRRLSVVQATFTPLPSTMLSPRPTAASLLPPPPVPSQIQHARSSPALAAELRVPDGTRTPVGSGM